MMLDVLQLLDGLNLHTLLVSVMLSDDISSMPAGACALLLAFDVTAHHAFPAWQGICASLHWLVGDWLHVRSGSHNMHRIHIGMYQVAGLLDASVTACLLGHC